MGSCIYSPLQAYAEIHLFDRHHVDAGDNINKDVQTMTPPFKEPQTLHLSRSKHIEMEIEMGFCFCFRINETQMCQGGSIVVKNKSFGVTPPWF